MRFYLHIQYQVELVTVLQSNIVHLGDVRRVGAAQVCLGLHTAGAPAGLGGH